jgi:glycogen debranching enzyme
VAFTVDNKAFGREEAKSIIESCRKLATPWGLRTLPEDSPNYRGRYDGNENERNKAYHQGSAWPWLIGPWNDALESAGEKRQRFEELETYLLDTGLGSIPELFDGSQPHTPRGCPSQAWSVAEMLRSIR